MNLYNRKMLKNIPYNHIWIWYITQNDWYKIKRIEYKEAQSWHDIKITFTIEYISLQILQDCFHHQITNKSCIISTPNGSSIIRWHLQIRVNYSQHNNYFAATCWLEMMILQRLHPVVERFLKSSIWIFNLDGKIIEYVFSYTSWRRLSY